MEGGGRYGAGRGWPRCARRRGEVSLLGLGEIFSFDLAHSDLEDWASGTSGYGSLYLQGPTALASLYANRVSQVWRIVHCIFSDRSLWVDRVS